MGGGRGVRVAAAATMVLVGACAGNSKSIVAPEPSALRQVTVRNNNWLDMAVYLIRGPSRFRIGTVSASSSGTFTVPVVGDAATEPIQIMADPIGSPATFTTEPVIVGTGQRLELRLMNPLSMSTIAVWDH